MSSCRATNAKLNECEQAVLSPLRPTQQNAVANDNKLAFYPNIDALLDSFDFTICQTAYDGSNLHVGKFTLWDLGRKRLAVHKVTFATATVRRMAKYVRQGFGLCNGTAQSILNTVIENPQLVRGDVQYVD